LLTLHGPSRRRLVADPLRYRQALQRRPTLIVATGAQRRGALDRLAPVFGLDGRALLPPFFPVLRSQGTLFVETLARVWRRRAAARGAGRARVAATRALVHGFGALLEAWPALFAAARRAREG